MQTLSFYIYIFLIEIIVKKNNNEPNKNDQFYAYLNFFKPINITINLFSLLLLAEFGDPNWYISFINIIKKSLL